MYCGCNKVHTERPQQYDNFRNIYYLENTDDFTFGRNSDRQTSSFKFRFRLKSCVRCNFLQLSMLQF